MANYDYFKQYVSEMERIKAKTAHDEHVLEFRALTAKMINDAIPEIKQYVLEEVRRELKLNEKQEEKQQEVNVRVTVENVKEKIADALNGADTNSGSAPQADPRIYAHVFFD